MPLAFEHNRLLAMTIQDTRKLEPEKEKLRASR